MKWNQLVNVLNYWQYGLINCYPVCLRTRSKCARKTLPGWYEHYEHGWVWSRHELFTCRFHDGVAHFVERSLSSRRNQASLKPTTLSRRKAWRNAFKTLLMHGDWFLLWVGDIHYLPELVWINWLFLGDHLGYNWVESGLPHRSEANLGVGMQPECHRGVPV